MKFDGELPAINKIVRPDFDNGHWKFDKQMGDGVGFIYIIRDKYLQRFYLGKKLFYGAGKLNKGKESNWKRYKSSSKSLADHFKERPAEEFEFICIEEYKTKGTLSYAETWTLCLVEAPTNDMWYNRLIEKVSWPVREPISDKHKQRLQHAISWGAFNENSLEIYKGLKNDS
jgi:hypothetical protein